jgi:hypothetical protein
MPRRASRWAGTPPTSSPPKRTVPPIGSSRPAIVVMVVVLPAPLGPSSATTSPGATAIRRSRTTGVPA